MCKITLPVRLSAVISRKRNATTIASGTRTTTQRPTSTPAPLLPTHPPTHPPTPFSAFPPPVRLPRPSLLFPPLVLLARPTHHQHSSSITSSPLHSALPDLQQLRSQNFINQRCVAGDPPSEKSSSHMDIDTNLPNLTSNLLPCPSVAPLRAAPALHATRSEPLRVPSVRRRPRPSAHSFVRSRELGNHPHAYAHHSSHAQQLQHVRVNADGVPRSLLTLIEGRTLRRLDNGRYVPLDHPAVLVRSTISIAFSHDGSLFASTHGDHTVKVFEYPSGRQVACLQGHPRTPWTVRFHPTDKRFVASGCLGYDCRIWDVSKGTCIRKHAFRNSISCVSFSPDGDLLAVTSGRQLLLWDYWNDTRDPNRSFTTVDNHAFHNMRIRNQPSATRFSSANPNAGANANVSGSSANDHQQPAHTPGIPRELLEGDNPFHMVDFHPSGTMLMTGEKNRYQQPSVSNATTTNNANNQQNNNANAPPTQNGRSENDTANANANTNANANNAGNANANANANAPPSQDEQQFTLKLVVHRFDRRMERRYTEPVLEVPRAVAYNDAGIHFSPCGTMLAACIPAAGQPAVSPRAFRIAVLSLVPRRSAPIGTVLFERPLDCGHVTALTNLKFSATSEHLLAGFSFRPTNPVLRGQAEHYDATVRHNDRHVQHLAQPDSPPPRGVPQVRVVDIFKVGAKFPIIRSLCADMDVTDGHGGGAEDEINVAVFAPVAGVADGIVYGTQKGRIRLFQLATGPIDKLAAVRGAVPSPSSPSRAAATSSRSNSMSNLSPNPNPAPAHHPHPHPQSHPMHISPPQPITTPAPTPALTAHRQRHRAQPRGRRLHGHGHGQTLASSGSGSGSGSSSSSGGAGAARPFDVHPGSGNRSRARLNSNDEEMATAAASSSTGGTVGVTTTRRNSSNSNAIFDFSRMFELRHVIAPSQSADQARNNEHELPDDEGEGDVDDEDDDDEDLNVDADLDLDVDDDEVDDDAENECEVNMSSLHSQQQQQPRQPQQQDEGQRFGFGRSAVGVGLGLLAHGGGLFRRFRQVETAVTAATTNRPTTSTSTTPTTSSSSAQPSNSANDSNNSNLRTMAMLEQSMADGVAPARTRHNSF